MHFVHLAILFQVGFFQKIGKWAQNNISLLSYHCLNSLYTIWECRYKSCEILSWHLGTFKEVLLSVSAIKLNNPFYFVALGSTVKLTKDFLGFTGTRKKKKTNFPPCFFVGNIMLLHQCIRIIKQNRETNNTMTTIKIHNPVVVWAFCWCQMLLKTILIYCQSEIGETSF